MTLRAIIERSDLIVLGKVLDVVGGHSERIEEYQALLESASPKLRPAYQRMIERAKASGSTTGDVIAKISVTKIMKGKANAEIGVTFKPGLVCPTPPRFPISSNLVLFLTRTGVGRLETVGLSDGAIEVTQAEADLYARFISEFAEIAADTDSNSRTNRTVEWLVKLTENPLTRWHGIADLVNRKSILGKDIPSKFPNRLSAAQIERMKTAALSSQNIEQGDREVLKIVLPKDPMAVARHVIAYLERAKMHETPGPDGEDNFQDPWEIYDNLFFLAEIGGDSARFATLMSATRRTDFVGGAEKRVSLVKQLLPEASRGVKAKSWWKE